MIEKDIVAGNCAIAEFMGGYRYPDIPEAKDIWHTEYGGIHVLNMKYDHSWNWLMPVVEKIEETTEVDINGNFCKIYCNDGNGTVVNTITADSDEKKTAVWQAVVEFIRWHNSQPQNSIDNSSEAIEAGR